MLYEFFYFMQKTTYEMRISDWSSDVCSSDLLRLAELLIAVDLGRKPGFADAVPGLLVRRLLLVRWRVLSPSRVPCARPLAVSLRVFGCLGDANDRFCS